MSEIVLKYHGSGSIEELIKEALKAEENELLAALLRTKEHLLRFEDKYHLPTSKFISASIDSLKIDDMEAIEWSGEYETLERIEERLKKLREIEICA